MICSSPSCCVAKRWFWLVFAGLMAAQVPLAGAGASGATGAAGTAATVGPGAPQTEQPQSAETTVELSPFVVNADSDVGYQAANTAAGSRLNTALKDTAAAITPITKEFLEDIGATSLSDLLSVASNAEPEFEDGAGFNAISARRSDAFNSPFRIRGQLGAVAIDLAETGIPVDLSDIERVEVASGPNSVLFGNGATGGLFNMSTKRASVRKTSVLLRSTAGSWSSLRQEFDANQVLLKNRLALRLFGLYSERDGWRSWDFEDTRRLTGAVTLKPWTTTTLSASYGRGELDRNISMPWNAMDQLTLWRSLGSKLSDGPADLAGAGTAVISTVNRYTFMENDGTVYNLRNRLTSRGPGGERLLSAELFPFEYNFTGPGATFSSEFQNTILRLEQKVGNQLVLEGAYQKNSADNAAYTVGESRLALQADPNLNLTLPNGGSAPNPRAGQLFMENNWRPETARFFNEVLRVTAAYDLNLGPRWGQHRFAGLFESSRFERGRNDGVIILVDQNGVPVGNANQPENTANFYWRRRYLKEGDFQNYYSSDPSIEAPHVQVGTRDLRGRLVSFSQTGTSLDRRDTDSLMFAMQNFWFQRRLVTTYGYRRDDTVFQSMVARRIGASDPRVVAGERIANEWILVPDQFDTQGGVFPTRTFGAVYHVNRRVSLFFNQSSNVGTPRFDRTVIPGVLPPASRGRGRDFGVMLNLSGDDRYFARINIYETKQTGDAPLAPGGAGINQNYFTQAINPMLDYLLQRQLITGAERDANYMSFSAMTIDSASRGVEIEFVANPLPNWTMRASYSYTDTRRENYFPEREPHLSRVLTLIRSRDDRGVMSNGLTLEQQIAELIYDIEDYAATNETATTGNRPAKANFTTRYRWAAGRLKGAFVGGGFQYQSPPYLQRMGDVKVFGHDVRDFQLFAGQSMRLPWLGANLRVQLNVYNVTNANRIQPGRYTANGTALYRVYLRAPRNYRLSATVEF